jgi:adenine deaminase
MDKTLIDVALGKKPAQLVLRNVRVIHVFTGEIELTNIAIHNGLIAGCGDYSGMEEIDFHGAYCSPGFIDGHVHIESSMLSPHEFACEVIPKGTTSVIADPHEIANVCGLDGIMYMLESAKQSPIHVYMMIPSCVPATPFETAGARIDVSIIKKLKNHKQILGLGEVMDYPGVISSNPDMLDKIEAMKNKVIDGHSPMLTGKELNAYVSVGIRTDHEPSTLGELTERLQKGMYVHLREGSQTRNVLDLLPGVNALNHTRCLFCTDDLHPEDIRKDGHINYNVNLALRYGLDPIWAIRMATSNIASCYQLPMVGAIAPGYHADVIVFDSLEQIHPHHVFINGKLVAKNGKSLFNVSIPDASVVQQTMHVDLSNVDLRIPLKQSLVKVIGLIQNNVTTTSLQMHVPIEDGYFCYPINQDITKLCVFERHTYSGRIGKALVHGYGLLRGAIAMSIAHDSHNIIAIGKNDEDIVACVKELSRIGGGIVMSEYGKVIHSLVLDIAGLMSSRKADYVISSLQTMTISARDMGVSPLIVDPFIQVAFLALPVIPELKLTDFGLFDGLEFTWTSIEVGEK